MKAKLIAVLVIAGLFLVILIQNTQVVTLRLFFWQVAMSQVILIPLLIVLGFIAGYLVAKLTGRG